MPIETICQGCSKKLRVADEHAGKQARCPGCGNIYIVPQPTPSSYSPLETPASSTPLASDPLPSESTRTPAAKPAAPNPFADSNSTTAPTFSSAPAFANPPAKDVSDRWLMKIDDGREFGPVDRATLDQWYRERRIGASTQLKRELDAQWQPASYVYPSLGGAAPVASAATYAANPFAEQPAYGSPNPYATPGHATNYAEPHRGGVILTFAILSWVFCLFFGIAAWVMAAGDMKKMRAGQMDSSGYGLTQAGMIIAIIHVVLNVLAIGLVIMLGVLGAMNG